MQCFGLAYSVATGLTALNFGVINPAVECLELFHCLAH